MSNNTNKKPSLITMIVKFLKDLYLTFNLIRDYLKGSYRDVSRVTIASIVVTLFYMVLSPIGYIPLIGQIDDVIAIFICLKVIQKDLIKYKQFKNS